MAIHRDTIVALLLLLFTAVMWHASYDIEITPYSSMESNVWPRIILVGIGLFSALLLARSVIAPEALPEKQAGSFFVRYRNAMIIYALFFGFLITLPYLGMLLGAMTFVFLALTALGHLTARAAGIHAAIAVLSVGVMWAIFTFALKVRLPEGELLSIY